MVSMNFQLMMARKARGLSQVALATRIGVNQADIVRIEYGWIPPRVVRRRLARALKSTDAALFGDAVAASVDDVGAGRSERPGSERGAGRT